MDNSKQVQLSDQDFAIAELLKKHYINMQVFYTHSTIEKTSNPYHANCVNDHFTIVLDNKIFNYSQGVGHRAYFDRMVVPVGFGKRSKFLRSLYNVKSIYAEIDERFLSRNCYNSKLTHQLIMLPGPANPIDCLLSDTQGVENNFNDWCAEHDYDNDSIKSLDIYRACMKNGEKFRRIFNSKGIKQLETILEGY